MTITWCHQRRYFSLKSHENRNSFTKQKFLDLNMILENDYWCLKPFEGKWSAKFGRKWHKKTPEPPEKKFYPLHLGMPSMSILCHHIWIGSCIIAEGTYAFTKWKQKQVVVSLKKIVFAWISNREVGDIDCPHWRDEVTTEGFHPW